MVCPGTRNKGRRGGWARLAAAAVLLSVLYLILAKGCAPPGAAGEVIRRNLGNSVDATPLFYTEVEEAGAHTYDELFIE